jgi:His-Xaa-Ser system protein HxsD
MQAIVDSKIYDLETVKEACFWFTSDCLIDIQVSGDKFTLSFSLKEGAHGTKDIVGEFNNALLETSIRRRLRKETEPIRNTILACTLSHFINTPMMAPKDGNGAE